MDGFACNLNGIVLMFHIGHCEIRYRGSGTVNHVIKVRDRDYRHTALLHLN